MCGWSVKENGDMIDFWVGWWHEKGRTEASLEKSLVSHKSTNSIHIKNNNTDNNTDNNTVRYNTIQITIQITMGATTTHIGKQYNL